jgi:L-cystine uptake protein TcyP (sodium:dicarboxylate symporter family)
MAEQNYANHPRFVTGFHKVLFPLIAAILIGSFVNLYKSIGDESRIYSASLITALAIAAIMQFFFSRIFPLKAQDRAIRAEENLRHYVLTGKLLDSRLDTLQIVALRFAPDAEFPELARKAADSGMAPKDIKLAIKAWKGDYYRV